jgi:hypothetical protein
LASVIGDRNPLLLAARERARALPFPRLEIERVQSALRRISDLWPAGQPQPERDVLAGTQIGPQVAALEDECDLVCAIRRKLGLAEARERASEHDHVTGGRLVETGGEMQGGALTRARRPEECDELPGLDAQVESAQRHRLRRTGTEDAEDVVELERAETDLRPALRLAVEAF